MLLKQLHHVAYRCVNTRETVNFYRDILGLKYAAATQQDMVPSTGERCPFIHVFMAMEDGSCVAFFEVPECDPMGVDPNTPDWVQHLALRADKIEDLHEIKGRLEERGLDFVGPIDHGPTHSLYFHDPSGHRLEVAVHGDLSIREEQARNAESLLDKWDEKWHAAEAS